MLVTCSDLEKIAKNWVIRPFMTSQNDVSTAIIKKKCHYGTRALFYAQKRNIQLNARFSPCFCNASEAKSQNESILAKMGTFLKNVDDVIE